VKQNRAVSDNPESTATSLEREVLAVRVDGPGKSGRIAR
jgi:hypothetical protein